MTMILIDGDEIAFKSSAHSSVWSSGLKFYKTKKEALKHSDIPPLKHSGSPQRKTVENQIDSMIKKIVGRAKYTWSLEKVNVCIVLSGETNYRKRKYPDYKSNRNNRDLPFYLPYAKKYIQENYHCRVAVDEEGDDLLGWLQCTYEFLAIASTDKDMRTIPGFNYNIMKDDGFQFISEHDADINFYTQILTGDVADGVKGIKGIGPKRAAKMLEGAWGKQEMLTRVLAAYDFAKMTQEDVEKAGFLLYIRRKQDEMWSIEGVRNGTI